MDDDVGDGMFESLKCNNATYLQHLLTITITAQF